VEPLITRLMGGGKIHNPVISSIPLRVVLSAILTT
jgi:hypothetical protein